jgi:hypothetical protein
MSHTNAGEKTAITSQDSVKVNMCESNQILILEANNL